MKKLHNGVGTAFCVAPIRQREKDQGAAQQMPFIEALHVPLTAQPTWL